MSNWPDPDKPGVPLNPDVDGFHWLGNAAFVWVAKVENWGLNGIGFPPEFFANTSYHGPVLTPAEVSAIKDDLTHWQECCHAFEFDLQSARADAKRLREALQHADAAMDSLMSDEMPYTQSCAIWRTAAERIRAALEEKT
jgi:hypothetical protein